MPWTSLTGTLSFSLLLVGQIFLYERITEAVLWAFTSRKTFFWKQQQDPKLFCLQQHKGCKAVKYPTEIAVLLFQMSLIHYLTFESTLPPNDALISLGTCWSLLFSLHLDKKHPLVYKSQLYSICMGGNVSTDCPIVQPWYQNNFTHFALARISARTQIELGALTQACHHEKAGSHAHLLKGRLFV